MVEFIIGSINKLYLTFINDKETLWGKMTALKAQLELYKKTREAHLLTKLRRLMKTPSRPQIDSWLAQWLSFYNDAEKAGLPDVNNGRAQIEFLTALQGLDSQWATAKLTTFLETDETKQPTLSDLIGQFNRVRSILPTMTANRPQRTFGAFPLKKDDQDDEQQQQSPSSPQPPTQIPPKLKGRPLSTRPYLYGLMH